MIEQFWQYGILAAILIFGFKIGLAIGFAGIKKKTAGIILIGYGLGLTLLSYICQPFTQQLYTLVYEYSFYIFAVIALVILITGFKTVYDWKVTGRNTGTTTCMAMVAPCPCCFGAILASIILISPMAGVSSLELGSISSILLIIVMGATYIFSTKIVKKVNKPYPLFLGNFMIFMGLYFLLCIMILPNMNLITQGTPVDLQSFASLIEMAILGAIFLLVGVYYANKKSSLLQF